MTKMNWCPLDVGGLMGPTTSIPHISNGHKEDIGWSHRGSDRLTPFGISDSVRNHLQPIVAKSSKSIPKLGSGLVSSANIIMSFLECLLHLFVWKAVSCPASQNTLERRSDESWRRLYTKYLVYALSLKYPKQAIKINYKKSWLLQ